MLQLTLVGVALVIVNAFAGSPITMVPSAKHPVAVSVTRTTYVPAATLAKVNVFPDLVNVPVPNVPEVNTKVYAPMVAFPETV